MQIVKKQYIIKSDSERVFKALTDPLEIEQWSGAPAIMQAYENGEFSLWGGSILGINKVVEKNLIQQDWKESKWEAYSRVTFEIAMEEGQTTLNLVHSNIPDHSTKSINKGWDDYYLGPLKSYIEQ